MINYITKEYSEAKTPISSQKWQDKSKQDRIDLILKTINSHESYYLN